MADLDTQHKSHGMGLHQEQLAGRTQQVFFSPAAEDNFLFVHINQKQPLVHLGEEMYWAFYPT